MVLVILSVVSVQTSTTPLYLSSSVIRPRWYWFSMMAIFVFGFLQQLGFARRDFDIVHGDGDAGLGGIVEAQVLDAIQHLCRSLHRSAPCSTR